VRLEWSDESLRDLGEQVRFVEARNPAAAQRIARRILAAAEFLAEFPLGGRAGVRPNTREWPVRRLPYLIVYAVGRDVVTILHVKHAKQRR
jgi:toxin ParE1/3/4